MASHEKTLRELRDVRSKSREGVGEGGTEVRTGERRLRGGPMVPTTSPGAAGSSLNRWQTLKQHSVFKKGLGGGAKEAFSSPDSPQIYNTSMVEVIEQTRKVMDGQMSAARLSQHLDDVLVQVEAVAEMEENQEEKARRDQTRKTRGGSDDSSDEPTTIQTASGLDAAALTGRTDLSSTSSGPGPLLIPSMVPSEMMSMFAVDSTMTTDGMVTAAVKAARESRHSQGSEAPDEGGPVATTVPQSNDFEGILEWMDESPMKNDEIVMDEKKGGKLLWRNVASTLRMVAKGDADTINQDVGNNNFVNTDRLPKFKHAQPFVLQSRITRRLDSPTQDERHARRLLLEQSGMMSHHHDNFDEDHLSGGVSFGEFLFEPLGGLVKEEGSGEYLPTNYSPAPSSPKAAYRGAWMNRQTTVAVDNSRAHRALAFQEALSPGGSLSPAGSRSPSRATTGRRGPQSSRTPTCTTTFDRGDSRTPKSASAATRLVRSAAGARDRSPMYSRSRSPGSDGKPLKYHQLKTQEYNRRMAFINNKSETSPSRRTKEKRPSLVQNSTRRTFISKRLDDHYYGYLPPGKLVESSNVTKKKSNANERPFENSSSLSSYLLSDLSRSSTFKKISDAKKKSNTLVDIKERVR